VLIGANFRLEVMGNMNFKNRYKYFRKITQYGYRLIVTNRGAFALFEDRNNYCLLPKGGKTVLR
jgi:hypothetical protein